MTCALLYRADGSEQRSLHFTGPGRSHYAHDTACLEYIIAEGEIVRLHTGHGVFRAYVVVACDARTALLQASVDTSVN